MYIRSRCAESTPNNLQKNDPNNGPPTPVLKLNAPVSKVNIVASTLCGVILVNNIIEGKKLNA